MCSVPGLTAYTCTVLVSDGRGGSTQASKSVTGTNSPPSCVANGGQTLTVWHLDWTDGISLALFDADGDSIPGCTHVRSSNSQAIGIGPVYQNCTRNAPLFRFRPSCAGPPVSANLRVYVSDGWVETVCSVPMDCYLP